MKRQPMQCGLTGMTEEVIMRALRTYSYRCQFQYPDGHYCLALTAQVAHFGTDLRPCCILH